MASARISCTPTGTKRIPLRVSGPARGKLTWERLRQPTATHGLEGTKWKFSTFETTVTSWSLPNASFIS